MPQAEIGIYINKWANWHKAFVILTPIAQNVPSPFYLGCNPYVLFWCLHLEVIWTLERSLFIACKAEIWKAFFGSHKPCWVLTNHFHSCDSLFIDVHKIAIVSEITPERHTLEIRVKRWQVPGKEKAKDQLRKLSSSPQYYMTAK